MIEEDGFARADGVSLYYRVSGSGDPLLLIHAANTDTRLWDRSAAALSRRYRVVRYDMRGMGRSESGTGSYTVAGDIDAVLAACGIDSCTVVGASAGGYCALEYALTRAKCVSALVLVSAGLFGVDIPQSAAHQRDSRRLEEAIAGGSVDAMAEVYAQMWLDGPGQASDRVAPGVRALFLDMAQGAFRRRTEYRFPEPLNPSAALRLREIACPTLVATGELDYEESHAFAALFEREIKGVLRTDLAGVAHLPPLERPEGFVALLEEFVTSIGGNR